MKKYAFLLLALAGVGGLSAGEFVETFEGEKLSPQNWMTTYAVQCRGIDYQRPLQGKLLIKGLKDAKAQTAIAYLDRDANLTAGDFRLVIRWEARSSAAGTGAWRFQLLTENGEVLLGVSLDSAGGRITSSGIKGHSCSTTKNAPLTLAEPHGVLEIVRRKKLYQVLAGGKVLFEANGDTAAAASFRLQVTGEPGTLTLTGLELKNLR